MMNKNTEINSIKLVEDYFIELMIAMSAPFEDCGMHTGGGGVQPEFEFSMDYYTFKSASTRFSVKTKGSNRRRLVF